MCSDKADEYIQMAVTNSTYYFGLSFLLCVCVDAILFLRSYSRFETVYGVGIKELLP